MQPAVHIYSDEVGPTGMDLLNREQPFFVASYVILDPNTEEAVLRQAPEIISRHSPQTPKELKFTRLAKSSPGMRIIIDLMKLLDELSISINICLLEKRFQACALAVETFLDPTTHPRRPPQHEMKDARQWLANTIHECITDNSLQDLLLGIKSGHTDQIRAAGKCIADQLALHPDGSVRQASRLIHEGLPEFFNFGETEADTHKKIPPTSTISAFLPIILGLNAALLQKGLHGEIICDEDAQSGSYLNQALDMAIHPEKHGNTLTEFTGPSHLPVTNITGRREINSVASLPVQLADLAAGLFNRVAITRTTSSHKLESKLGKAWEGLHRCINRGAPHHFFMCSNRTRRALL